jgi:SAM-dependent methyltransferase
MLQFGMAIGVVGFLIWILGIISASSNSEPIEILGIRPFGKPLLRDVYASFYGEFVRVSRRVPPGPCVELGSGGGFLRDLLPSVVTSVVVVGVGIDTARAAEALPFRTGTVSAFFLLDAFHHLRDPHRFLAEVERCLRPAGRLVMVEPANTAWGRLVRKSFHHEPFDERAGWGGAGNGTRAAANLALPWIVFVRDRARFEQAFPRLALVRYEPHTPFRFLLSGGITYRSLVGQGLIPLVKLLERALFPLNRILGMHVTIEIQKAGGGR